MSTDGELTLIPAAEPPPAQVKPVRKRKRSRKKKAKAAATESTSASAPAIVDYLAALGVDVDPGDLAPPSVDTLFHASDSPTKWIDRDGNAVPKAVGELYRIDAAVGTSRTQRTIRAKEAEGFRVVPREAGLRWQSVGLDDENHIAMVRTPGAKKAYDQAQAMKRAKRMGKHRTQPQLPGGGVATVETNTTDVSIPLRS